LVALLQDRLKKQEFTWNVFMQQSSNVVEWSFLLRIWDVLGSYLGQKTSYIDWGFVAYL
jgi:hypothetical protein